MWPGNWGLHFFEFKKSTTFYPDQTNAIHVQICDAFKLNQFRYSCHP